MVYLPSYRPLVLRVSHFLDDKSFFQRDLLEPWARAIEDGTGGAVRFAIFGAGTAFGAGDAQARQVEEGTVDIALALRGAEPGRFPRTSVLELPFLVDDAVSGSRALRALHRAGHLHPDFSAFEILGLFVQDPGGIHTFAKRVVRPEDVAGLRLRTPNPTAGEAIARIGAIPVPLQVHAVPAAIQRGAIDGLVTNWANPIRGFTEVTRFHTPIAFYTSVFLLLMRADRHKFLPRSIRAVIERVSRAHLARRAPRAWARWGSPVKAGVLAAGHEIVTCDPEDLDAWRAALAPLREARLAALAADGVHDPFALLRQIERASRTAARRAARRPN